MTTQSVPQDPGPEFALLKAKIEKTVPDRTVLIIRWADELKILDGISTEDLDLMCAIAGYVENYPVPVIIAAVERLRTLHEGPVADLLTERRLNRLNQITVKAYLRSQGEFTPEVLRNVTRYASGHYEDAARVIEVIEARKDNHIESLLSVLTEMDGSTVPVLTDGML